MKIIPSTLRGKLIGVFLVPTLTLVIAFSAIIYVSSRDGLEQELGKRLTAIAQTFASQVSEGLDAKQISRVDDSKTRVLTRFQERLVELKKGTDVNRAFLVAPDQTIIADSEKTDFGSNLYLLAAHKAEFDAVVQTKSPQTTVLFSTENGFNKLGFAPILLTDEFEDEPRVVAVVGIEGSAQYFDLLNNLATLLLVLAIIGVFLVVIAATSFSRTLTRPIANLVQAAQRLGRGEFEQPVPESGSEDEIGFLTDAFEEMRVNIVQRDAQMQMMLSGIAHEVRNPLGGMAIFCGLLEEDLTDRPAATEQVNKIQKELGYLEKVVTDFLDFARNIPIVSERFDATVFVDEIATLLCGDADDVGCGLITEVPTDLELTGGREKLRRALINVTRNAFQACSSVDGATVTLSVEAPNDHTRRITVADNGRGIAEEDLDQILAPFFTTREKGSGLGLALTKRIVDDHGGTLKIESRLGEGTKLVFDLPFDAGVRQTGAFSAEEIPEGWMG